MERNIDQLPFTHPQLGTWPTIQACVLTGNGTSDLLVGRLALNPLSHPSQGSINFHDDSFNVSMCLTLKKLS